MYKNIITMIFILAVFAEGQVARLQKMDGAIRDNGNYFAWIYFSDKDKSIQKTSVSNNAIKRRNKVNPNKNYEWYDLNPSDNYIDKVLNTGAKLRHQSRWLNAVSVECSESQLIEISYMPFVKDIQPMKQHNRDNVTEQPATKSLNKFNIN